MNVRPATVRRSARLLPLLCVLGLLVPGGAAAQETQAQKPGAESIFADFYPASPYDIVVSQPDGSKFKAKLTNAEIGAGLELEGYTVAKRADGWWVYASGRDADGALLETPAIAGVDAVPAGIAEGAGRTPNIWSRNGQVDIRTQMFRSLQIASRKAQQQALAAGEPRLFKFPVIMLATWWDADEGQTSPQFQEGSDTPEFFKELLDGFGGNPRGTLTEFYFEDSFGQFLVQVDVYGPYVSQRSRQDRCYYGGIEQPPVFDGDLDPTDSQLGIGGGGAIGMAIEGVPQADPEVDFSQYDNDGDLRVDFTAMLHSGPDMAATGDPCHTWSHAIEATLGTVPEVPDGIPTNDGVTVDRLFTMPEIDLQIGVATHEMAHALGEPDYYNPSYTSMGTGDWDIMAGGSWFGNPPGSNPTGYHPASKVFQGWMTPTFVHDDVEQATLQPRKLMPTPGYQADQPNPNVLLVPTQWIKVGDTDQYGHEWTETDVYGLPLDGDKGYVVEGYYLENWSRTVNAPPIHPEMTRAPYFDRQALSSGLMVWHFDYFYRSNVYYAANNAGSDPDRPQMDPMEFDYNDNTQELQLGLTRGEPTDLVWGAANGITSGTRRVPPGIPNVGGQPQQTEVFEGVVLGPLPQDHEFTVEDNPANFKLTARVVGVGDCTLEVLHVVDGVEESKGSTDSGFVGAQESITVADPPPGDYIARIGDFAGCGPYEGSVEFGGWSTSGAADTWSTWTREPTGWAFTNVGPALSEELDHSADAPGPEAITVDIVNLDDTEVDVAPGFARGALNANGGRGAVNVGRASAMSVPVFNNGGKAVNGVAVQVRGGTIDGPVLLSTTVDLAPYSRQDVEFDYTPAQEGFFDVYVSVDPADAVAEAHEGNNVQKSTGWAGPADARVLIVDDDGAADSEVFYAGTLAALGIPYAIITQHATAEEMAGFEAVIWEAGLERYQGQMNPEDRLAVAQYLEGGGKLLYSSPRAAAALGEGITSTSPLNTADMPLFLKYYFGATYVDTLQVGGGEVQGLKGDILGADVFPTDVFPGRPLQDFFRLAEYSGEAPDVAFGEAAAVARWEKGTEDALMATRVEGNDEHGNFQTVFLGFNLQQLLRTGDAIDIVSSVMDHFGVEQGTYSVSNAEPVVYHPQVRNRISGTATPIKVIALGAEFDGPVTLSYRRHGTEPYATVPMVESGHPGAWSATIPGNFITPDSVDYFIKAGDDSTYDPRAAAFDGAVVHAIGVAVPEVPNPGDPDDPGTLPIPVGEAIRLGGPDRVETAIEISKDSFEDGEAQSVVLARSDLYPDALAGTPLAVAKGGPMLLTESFRLHPSTAAELQRVLPADGTVYVLGGREAIDAAVVEDLNALGYEPVRVSGPTRIETALAIATELGDPETVLIATGYDFADALAAGAAAAHADGAVVLTTPDVAHPATTAYLAEHGTDEYAIGGPAARAYPTATAVVGESREETAVAVADEFFTGPTVVGLARRDLFPDSLTGGVHIGRMGGPMLITFTDRLHASASDYLCLNALALDTAYIYGGEAAVQPPVMAAALDRILGGTGCTPQSGGGGGG